MGERRKFDDGFKATACRRVMSDGETVHMVAADIEVVETVLRSWLKKAGWKPGPGIGAGRSRAATEGQAETLPEDIGELVGEAAGVMGSLFIDALTKAYKAGISEGEDRARSRMLAAIGAPPS